MPEMCAVPVPYDKESKAMSVKFLLYAVYHDDVILECLMLGFIEIYSSSEYHVIKIKFVFFQKPEKYQSSSCLFAGLISFTVGLCMHNTTYLEKILLSLLSAQVVLLLALLLRGIRSSLVSLVTIGPLN